MPLIDELIGKFLPGGARGPKSAFHVSLCGTVRRGRRERRRRPACTRCTSKRQREKHLVKEETNKSYVISMGERNWSHCHASEKHRSLEFDWEKRGIFQAQRID